MVESDGPRSRLSSLGRHAPAFVIVAMALALSLQDGGYARTDWYPAAVFSLALACVTVAVAGRAVVGQRGSFTLAVALLGAFTLWSYLSISWAAVPSDAWDGANRTLLYCLGFALVGSCPWSRFETTVLLGLVVTVTSAIAGGTLLVGSLGEAAEGFLLVGGRLSEPTGYANTTATLFLMVLWPALHLASSPRLLWPLRACALGAACVLLQAGVLTQSRGGAIALVVGAVVYLMVTPRRWSALVALACIGAVTASGWDALMAVRSAGEPDAMNDAFQVAGTQVLLHSLVVAAVGALVILVTRRLRPGTDWPPRLLRAGNVVLASLAISLLLALGAVLSANRDWLGARWDDFERSGYDRVESDANRFGGSLGSGRYDFYRIALDEFRERPVQGIGTENFSVPYLENRRTGEAPIHPHSLGVRLLAQLGIVGFGLMTLFVGAVVWGFVASRRRLDRDARSAGAAALASGFLWLIHAQGDWLWAMPSVTLLGLSLLAVAARPLTATAEYDRRAAPARSRRSRAVRLSGVALVGSIGAGTLGFPAVAARYEAAGQAALRDDPGAAYLALGKAAALNPLTADPLVVQGLIARELGENAVTRRHLTAALSREPDNWFVHFELGLSEAEAERTGSAQEHLEAAQRLNPRQRIIARVRRSIRAGRGVDAAALEQQLFDEIQVNVGATG